MNPIPFFYQGSLIIGIPVIVILFYYSRKNRNNLFLAISLLNIWYALLINNLNQSLQILEFPYLIRTGSISVFLFFPFLYLYARGAFYPNVFFKKADLLWFLPLTIYLIDLGPFFLSDSNYKIAVFQERLKDAAFASKIGEGWIKLVGFEILLRYLSGVLFLIFQINIICKYWKTHSIQKKPENRIVFWHILILTVTYGLLVFPGIFGVLLHLSWYNISFVGINLSLSLTITAFFLLFSPRILYGFLPFSIVQGMDDLKNYRAEKPVITESTKESKNRYEDEKIAELIAKIEDYVNKNQVFLDQNYTIYSLSTDIGVPVYQLSPLINNYYDETYSTWINQFRVRYFMELCKDPLYKELTLEALAKESGFSNRTTFINSFKKITGTTPSAYLKQGLK